MVTNTSYSMLHASCMFQDKQYFIKLYTLYVFRNIKICRNGSHFQIFNFSNLKKKKKKNCTIFTKK